MNSLQDFYKITGQIAELKESLIKLKASDLIEKKSELAEAISLELGKLEASLLKAASEIKPPADKGLSALLGIGPEATRELGSVPYYSKVEQYDEMVARERILAVADLYYIYQLEALGVFKVISKLQELFNAGAIRISSETGAVGLYRFDRKKVLRYTRRERLQAYRRVFGYTSVPAAPGAKPNAEFHSLFEGFITQVARFWRDKRVSEVVRERASDPSFGSIAIVRRAGLDLRNNLKHASYGHVNILRTEVAMLLNEAFDILEADDIKRVFGAETAWDVVEEVSERYFNEKVNASQRNRLAETGKSVISWLAEKYVLEPNRAPFEAYIINIAEPAEEWLTSSKNLKPVELAEDKGTIALRAKV